MLKSDYKGTYFSKIEYPAYNGLLEQNLRFDYNLFKQDDYLGLGITVIFSLDELTGINKFEVLKARSDFHIKNKEKVYPEETFSIIKHSIDALRSHLLKAKNIDTHPNDIPDFSPQQLMSDLILLSERLNSV